MRDVIKPESESRFAMIWPPAIMAVILENLHNVITLSAIVQFGQNFLCRCRITCRWR